MSQAMSLRPPRWARPQWLMRYLGRRLHQLNPRGRARRITLMVCSSMPTGSTVEQAMMVFQVQLTRRQGVVPMTRDYIMCEEARLRGIEGGHRPPLRLAGE